MAYEYSLISSKSYKKCFEEADLIVSDVATFYHINKSEVRYHQTINYLYDNYPPVTTLCLANSPSPVQGNFSELNRFNSFLKGTLGLNVTCSHLRIEKPSFVQKVSGLTTFVEGKPVLILNSSTHQKLNHVIFTIIHELVHIYEAANDPKYMTTAALIGNYEYSQNAYPEEVQPLEDEANTIASLLCAPTISFEKSVLTKTFSELSIEYTMSGAATHNRLMNYFYHERGWDYCTAKQAVFAFRNDNIDQMEFFRNKLRSSLSRLIALPF